MNTKLLLLLIEDSPADAEFVLRALKNGGYDIFYQLISTGDALKAALAERAWHIVISDYVMPSFTGLVALTIVRETNLDLPFILVSGTIGEERAVQAMKAGAQDYVLKGNLTRLAPAVKRELQEAQRRREERTRERERIAINEKLQQFRRFFSPNIADLIVSGNLEDPFKWHRKEVSVLFFDLRGFTQFVETSEPEDVVNTLQEYYSKVGQAAQKYAGTIGHVAGDGVMVFFNDPIDTPDHPQKAVEMALECREEISRKWNAKGIALSYGAGIASGHATIGGIGSDGCWDYSVIGTVSNLASRLCSKAESGQILVSSKFVTSVESMVASEKLGKIELKGLARPVEIHNILRLKTE
jgi:adenylate cyclase